MIRKNRDRAQNPKEMRLWEKHAADHQVCGWAGQMMLKKRLSSKHPVLNTEHPAVDTMACAL